MNKINKTFSKIYLTSFSLYFFINNIVHAEEQVSPDDVNVLNNTANNNTNNAVNTATQLSKDLKTKDIPGLVADFILVITNYALTLMLGATIIMFLWGLAKYIFKGQGSESARSEGRKLMLWGVIGLFVMTSVWALVAVFASFVGHDKVVIPQF